MAIHVLSGKNNLQSESYLSNVQYVPFTIHADSEANLQKYFNPYVKAEKDGETLTASYRGYPLKGRTVAIPEGYIGAVMHESIKPVTNKAERKFHITHNFKSFTFWNWDKIPSKNDTFAQALDWIEIAEALHSPLTEE